MRVLSKLLSSRPYIVNKYITPEMTQANQEDYREEQIDVVVCDFLEMAWCAEHLGGIPKVLFEHNVETLIWRRYHEVEKSLSEEALFRL